MNDVDGTDDAGVQRAKWLHLKVQIQEEISHSPITFASEGINLSGRTWISSCIWISGGNIVPQH